MKIAVDFGNSRVKVSYQLHGQSIDLDWPNRIKINSDNELILEGNTIVTDKRSVTIGVLGGQSAYTPKKINQQYLLEHLLYIQQMFPEEALDLVALLPPGQFIENAREFKEKLLGFNNMSGYLVKDNQRINIKLHINSCKIAAEGVAIVNNIKTPENLLKIMLIDLGSSTTDIVVLENIKGNYVISNALTLSNVNALEIHKLLKRHLNNLYPEANFNEFELERNMQYQYQGLVHKLTDHQSVYDNVINQLLAEIANIDEYFVILAGGGSVLLEASELFNKRVPNFEIVPDHLKIFGNSRGALMF